jgi:hypothetical protein
MAVVDTKFQNKIFIDWFILSCVWGVDWILDLLTTCIHHSEL